MRQDAECPKEVVVRTRRATVAERRGIRIDIADTGVGFEPNPMTTEAGPLLGGLDDAKGERGLGMAMVRLVVLDHGGEVQWASTPGRGTVATVTLPLSEERVL
jgi:signal transduction histidine kinase